MPGERDIEPARTKLTGLTAEAALGRPPLLCLITGTEVAQTRLSGARAGRSRAAELALPDVPTISRLHARFTYVHGGWRISGLGRNGVVVNGAALVGQQQIYDGDLIRWGRHDDAPTSIVEIR